MKFFDDFLNDNISLDWHPTDHVSFSDNAHLRTIARESKVQVDDYNHGNDDGHDHSDEE